MDAAASTHEHVFVGYSILYTKYKLRKFDFVKNLTIARPNPRLDPRQIGRPTLLVNSQTMVDNKKERSPFCRVHYLKNYLYLGGIK